MIIGVFAALGLLAVAAVFISRGLGPPPAASGRPAAYDQVFKYCTNAFLRDESRLAPLRRTESYRRVAKLPPGAYDTDRGGRIYIMGGGMFQIILPSALQVARRFGKGIDVKGDVEQPRAIIGCTPEHLAKALDVYGMNIVAAPKTAGSRPSTGQK